MTVAPIVAGGHMAAAEADRMDVIALILRAVFAGSTPFNQEYPRR
jgi:hypothetical protein